MKKYALAAAFSGPIEVLCDSWFRSYTTT